MPKWYCDCEVAMEDIVVEAESGLEAEEAASEVFAEQIRYGNAEIHCTCEREE